MSKIYTYTCSMSWGGDTPTAELDDIVVSFTVSWGAPEQGPTYDSGGQPADPDEINDIEIISIDGKPFAEYNNMNKWEFDHFQQSIMDRLMDDHYDQMLETAGAQRYDYPD